MHIVHPSDLEPILAGDADARRALVESLSPVVRAHVTRALFRRRLRASGRDVRQEIADMMQEVFLALFADDAKWLRAWSPARGLSFPKFVGLLAERHVGAILRSGRRSPWTQREPEDFLEEAPSFERAIEDANVARRLLERLEGELSPRGRAFLRVLFLEEQSVQDATSMLGASPDAVYAWRNRIIKRARHIGGGLEENVSAPVRSRRVAHKKGGREEISMMGISKELTQELAAWPSLLRALVEGLSAAEVRAAGPHDGFSVVEHAWHLAELEQDAFAVRITRLLAEDAPSLADFNGELAAKLGRYREREIGSAVASFARARASNLVRLAQVAPEQWARWGTLEGVGRITLTDLVCRMLEHDRSHAAELVESFASLHVAPAALPALGAMSRGAKPAPCAA